MVNFSSPCLTWCLWHSISPAFFHVMGIVDWAREGPSPKQHMECPLDGHKQMYVHVHRQTDADILTHQHAPLPGHGELLHTAVGQSETEERNKIPMPLRRESVLLVGCQPSYTVYSLIKKTHGSDLQLRETSYCSVRFLQRSHLWHWAFGVRIQLEVPVLPHQKTQKAFWTSVTLPLVIIHCHSATMVMVLSSQRSVLPDNNAPPYFLLFQYKPLTESRHN